jgi:hypothetical protein
VSHKKPVLPVVEVDQAFPLLTTDGAARGSAPSTGAVDQTPTVTAVIRDVLGWRPRRQDTKAFTAALDASFELRTVEGHIESRYVPRGYAVQADLGGVTGGQASLYTRAKTSHVEMTRILDALKPLRPDADPEDCEAYRVLVRDSVRQIVSELGMAGGPRIELVDSAFSILTGQQFGPAQGTSSGAFIPTNVALLASGSVAPNRFGHLPVDLAPPGRTADDIPGQLGALRERFGLTDDNVNTVEEEQIRTEFVTLVDLVVDLQDSWSQQRLAFGSDIGRGFLGTELVLINRLMAAAAEQVDELEAVLESALVSSAERQTIELDRRTRLTLDGLLRWMRSFLTEDGPRIARDTGRDGLTTSFTPTVLAILQALRCTLVARLVPCGSAKCGGLGTCHCDRKGLVSYIPLGCCSPLPPGMYAGRTRIAVSGLCGLLERLGRAAARIGRFSGAVLLDVVVTPFDDIDVTNPEQPILNHPIGPAGFVRVEVRGLHLRPTYLPAFVAGGGPGRQIEELVLPVRGSASADADSVMGVFARNSLPMPLANLDLDDGAVFAAAEVPLALVDGETGRVVVAPPVITWPDLRPAATPSGHSGPGLNDDWAQQPQDQRWIPQGTTSSLPEKVECTETDDCTEPCRRECDKECGDQCSCDCGCHLKSKLATTHEGVGEYRGQDGVTTAVATFLSKLDATTVQQGGDDLRQMLYDLGEELKEAGWGATAERRTGVQRQAGPEPDLRPASELVESIREARDQAVEEIATADQQIREADALAKRHREEAESVAATARDTSDLAATLKQFADQSALAAADATRRKAAAEQQRADLERELNIATIVAQKERDVSAEAPPAGEGPAGEAVGAETTPVVPPERGEPVTEVRIAHWFKKEGDPVEVGELVGELSIGSAGIQVHSPVAGRMRSLPVQAGQTVTVGTDEVVIEQDDGTTAVLVPTVALDLRGRAEQGQPVEEDERPVEQQQQEGDGDEVESKAVEARAKGGKASKGSTTASKGRESRPSRSGGSASGRRRTSKPRDSK